MSTPRSLTYFEYLCMNVGVDANGPYSNMLWELFSVDFYSDVYMDKNRIEDAYSLRNEYYVSENVDYGIRIDQNVNDDPRVLEVLVALALRFGSTILWDPETERNTAPEIFHMMCNNLGLLYFTNDNFDKTSIRNIIEVFLNRTYNSDGSNGGMFILKNPRADLRTVDIWYQMMWYLNERDEEPIC